MGQQGIPDGNDPGGRDRPRAAPASAIGAADGAREAATSRAIARPGARSPARTLALVVLGLAIGLLGAANLYLAGRSIGLVLQGETAVDWVQYLEASRRVYGGDLYAITGDYAFRYSPFLAAAFGLVAWMGAAGWRVLHLVAAMAMPSWPVRAAVLLSWPFWYDVQTGNLLVFVVLAVAWAIRGNRIGIAGFLALAILVPRPLMLPVAVWILSRYRGARVPFVAGLLVHSLAVLATGWGPDWIHTLLAAGEDAGLPSNIGPGRFIGTLPWMAIGLPLAAWLTWRGRLGFATLAASPYWLPYYLLPLVLEVDRLNDRASALLGRGARVPPLNHGGN